MEVAIRGKPPNLLLLITDQQRAPQHWPSEPGWLRELMPNDHELARTGLSFRNAFCSSCMCSPSRATLLTGTWPSTHGVTLTLTAADLRPDPRNMPYVLAAAAGIVRAGRIPRQRVLVQLARGARGRDPRAGIEPTLPPGMPTIGTRLRAAGYHVAYKGKWHLTKPLGPTWSQADAEAIDRDHGFGGWEPPDAGENARAEHFGGGNAGLKDLLMVVLQSPEFLYMIERGGDVVTRHIQDRSSRNITPNVTKYVKPGSRLHTDDWTGYQVLTERHGYEVETVNHSAKEYVRGDVHTNSIEGFWANVKRGISGTYVWISKKHLQTYLREFEYRHNLRQQPHLMFELLLQAFPKVQVG